MVRVKILLFARLKDIAGGGEFERSFASGSTVDSVWAALADEFPDLAVHRGAVSAAVNAEFAPFSAPVHDGDEVAFLPPVSGG